ncbi:MAG TPA: HWE histidine kinase domain-containing protein [Caulobacteraceae bacterium]|jgi:PAS domain S-box-containing protein
MTLRAYGFLETFAARFSQRWTLAWSVAMGLAIGLCGLALRAALEAAFSLSYPYDSLFLAVAFAAGAGGARAGFTAALVMALGGWAGFGDWFGDDNERFGVLLRAVGLALVAGLIVLLRSAVIEMRRTQASADEALASLNEAQEHGRRFVDLTPHIAWTADPHGNLTLLPKKVQNLTGATAEELMGQGWRALVHPDDVAVVDEAWRKSLATGEPYLAEFRGMRADGAFVWMRSQAYAARDDSGAVTGWYGLSENIDARKEAEHEREMLLREVDHRARNILAVLQGIVALMPKDDPEAFAITFRARLQALAGAHTLLAKSRWHGVELRALLEEELQPFGLEHIHLVGDALLVRSERVQQLSMIFHELTTNSAKYGCLSAPEGRLRVEWRVVNDAHVLVEWAEAGGPKVVAPPERQGFGSTLIRSIVRGRIGESVMQDWRPEGLCCAITLVDVLAEPEGNQRRTGAPVS